MTTMTPVKENFENIERVVKFEKDNVDVHSDIDVVTADAYDDNIKNEQHIQEVNAELDATAKDAFPEVEPEFGKTPDNEYTKKLTLDESVDSDEDKPKDGRSHKFYDDEDDMDEYLDYDMFDFIYGLVVAQTWPKPKNPLDHRMRTFLYTGSDDYLDTNSNKGVGQVGTEGDGAIVVYSDDASDFDDIKEVCELYKFEYEGPRAKRSPSMRWNFWFKIYVPMVEEDYPMMVEDYFNSIGMTLEDVMPAEYCKTYRKRQAKDNDQATTLVNDSKVNDIYDKYVKRAANSNEPLEIFISEMFAELEGAGLKYKKAALKRMFLDEFNDDFDDEE